MEKYFSFDDVLLMPQYSFIRSRKDVDTSQIFLGLKLNTPILSSNMDTVTGYQMAAAMALNGGLGVLHRFMSIEDNVKEFDNTVDTIVNNKHYNNSVYTKPMVSVGIGSNEIERALCLYEAGATHFLIDVAHGAAQHVVDQYDRLRAMMNDNVAIVVGNFADAEGLKAFNHHSISRMKPDAYKIGIGGGSLCTTRIVTGCGSPTLGSIIDCSSTGFNLIADGGIRNSGDIAKALSARASVVMVGQLLAGSNESPFPIIDRFGIKVPPSRMDEFEGHLFKRYRGSASFESYQVQNKVSDHRSPEGESSLIPYTGPVKDTLNRLIGGLRSSMSYCNSSTLTELRQNAKMIEVTNAGISESKAHAKKE